MARVLLQNSLEGIPYFLGVGDAVLPLWNSRRGCTLRIFVISALLKRPTVFRFPYPAPLFKEKTDIRLPTLIADRQYPLFSHWTSARSTFASYYCPIYTRQI